MKYMVGTLARRFGWRKVTYLVGTEANGRPIYDTCYVGKHDDTYRATPGCDYAEEDLQEMINVESAIEVVKEA